MVVEHFVDDDDGYQKWLTAHEDGFVLNAGREPKPTALVLHRASCWPIRHLRKNQRTFMGELSKHCATNRHELTTWIAAHIGGAPSLCKLCHR